MGLVFGVYIVLWFKVLYLACWVWCFVFTIYCVNLMALLCGLGVVFKVYGLGFKLKCVAFWVWFIGLYGFRFHCTCLIFMVLRLGVTA